MVTTLTHYKDGMAAVLIINHTERCDLNFNQRYSNLFNHYFYIIMENLVC